MPKVVIVILNWNSFEYTSRCIESLQKQDFDNYEIVVIDNGSNDGSLDRLMSAFRGIHYIRNSRNMGYAGGCNIGMAYAVKQNAAYVWLLNNDTEVEKGALRRMVECGEGSRSVGLLSPIVYFFSNMDEVQFCGSYFDFKAFEIRYYRSMEEAANRRDKQIVLWGSALLIKTDVIKKIGLYNEKYFSYWEDTEYSFRALGSGYENKVVADSKVYHHGHRKSNSALPVFPVYYYFYMIRNRFWFWWDNVRLINKLPALRKQLSISFAAILNEKASNSIANIDAILDALYCALLNKAGEWHPDTMGIPKRIKPLARKFVLAHPYLLADIISGDYSKVFREVARRMGLRRRQSL